MKQPGFIVAGALIAIPVIYLFVIDNEKSAPLDTAPVIEPSVQLPEVDDVVPIREAVAPSASSSIEEGRDPELELELQRALEQLAGAESALRESEREVEELEAMVDEIRARGEDPADSFDLALERFQPAFFRFQDAAAAYQEAERRVSEARAALEASR